MHIGRLVDSRERRATYGTGFRLIDVLGHGRPSRLALAKLTGTARLADYASVSNLNLPMLPNTIRLIAV
jgi:hypothetical protein